MSFVISWIQENVWGITAPALETILKIAERETDIMSKSIIMDKSVTELFHKNALATRRGDALPGTRYAYVRDGVGVLPVYGPIFPRANMMTDFSGATSAEALAKDFSTMLSNPDVKAILMDIDSPGGAITGISELASFIVSNRGVKPIHAFISGAGNSAAYWLASAADRVAIADTGEAGSIGVVAIYKDTGKKDETEGIKNIEIVSSQSPLKRVAPSTDAGKEKIQRLVDAAATVFIRAVANYRGTDEETVQEEFGQGDIYLGTRAVAQGLADEVSTFENEMKALCSDDKSKTKKRKEYHMTIGAAQAADDQAVVTYTVEGVREGSPETYEAIMATGRKEGAIAERKRIADIQALSISGCEKLISDAINNGDMTAATVAVEIVKAQQQRITNAGAGAAADATALATQAAGVASGIAADESGKEGAERQSTAKGIAQGGNDRRVARIPAGQK